MSYSIQERKFLSVLKKTGIDFQQFNDKTFDSMYSTATDELKYFLDWFCENINAKNVNTEEEMTIFNELENSGNVLSTQELEEVLMRSEPSYYGVEILDRDLVTVVLPGELEELKTELDKKIKIKADLESQHNKMKKRMGRLKEEIHVAKQNMTEGLRELEAVSLDRSDLLTDLKQLSQQKLPLSVHLDGWERSLVELRDTALCYYEKECRHLATELAEKCHTNLEELQHQLSHVKTMKIVSQGRLQETKFTNSLIREMLREPEAVCRSVGGGEGGEGGGDGEEVSAVVAELEAEVASHAEGLAALEVGRVITRALLDELCLSSQLHALLSQHASLLHSHTHHSSLLSHIAHLSRSRTLHLGALSAEAGRGLGREAALGGRVLAALDSAGRHREGDGGWGEGQGVAGVSGEMQGAVHSGSFHRMSRNTLLEEELSELQQHLQGPTAGIQLAPVRLHKALHETRTQLSVWRKKVRALSKNYLLLKDSTGQSERAALLLWSRFLVQPHSLQQDILTMQAEVRRLEGRTQRVDEERTPFAECVRVKLE